MKEEYKVEVIPAEKARAEYPRRIPRHRRPRKEEYRRLISLRPGEALVLDPCPGPHNRWCIKLAHLHRAARSHGFKITGHHSKGALIVERRR